MEACSGLEGRGKTDTTAASLLVLSIKTRGVDLHRVWAQEEGWEVFLHFMQEIHYHTYTDAKGSLKLVLKRGKLVFRK